jgi:hypothetical protein
MYMHICTIFSPGYADAVRKPMDLGTIKHRIETGEISTTLDFERCIQLMLTNAVMYNASDHFVHIAAQKMRDDALRAIASYREAMLATRLRSAFIHQGGAGSGGVRKHGWA